MTPLSITLLLMQDSLLVLPTLQLEPRRHVELRQLIPKFEQSNVRLEDVRLLVDGLTNQRGSLGIRSLSAYMLTGGTSRGLVGKQQWYLHYVRSFKSLKPVESGVMLKSGIEFFGSRKDAKLDFIASLSGLSNEDGLLPKERDLLGKRVGQLKPDQKVKILMMYILRRKMSEQEFNLLVRRAKTFKKDDYESAELWQLCLDVLVSNREEHA